MADTSIVTDPSRPHSLVFKRIVRCPGAIFVVGSILAGEGSHLEGERNRFQNINRVPHDYERADAEEPALVTLPLRWIGPVGGHAVLGDDVRFDGVGVVEKDGEGYHLDAGEQGWDADVEVGVGKFRGWFESVGVSEDPEYDLGRVSMMSGWGAVKGGLPIERTLGRPRS